MSKSRPIYQPLKLDPSGRAHLLVTDQPELPQGLAEFETWQATPDILVRLMQRLAVETTGLRLYALGTEAFLWDVYNIANSAGLGAGEIFLTRAGSRRRRVYCTHCKTINENITTSITPCIGCGAQLAVRDHFSRRLAAFMGVQADAEVPGEIPPAEAGFL